MKWLFLVHQIRTRNSRERVRVWRMTKKTGALLYRNSVYVIPYSKEGLEDFLWLCQQIRDSKGEASVFISQSTDDRENRALIALFNSNRHAEYTRAHRALEAILGRIRIASREKRLSVALHESIDRAVKDIEKRVVDIERIDFFGEPMKKQVRSMIARTRKQLGVRTHEGPSLSHPFRVHRKEFQAKTWATREHIHIDRLCSAWLIRRFIDPRAKFIFAPADQLPRRAILFDVFGEAFSHHGEDCTFETLLKSFGIRDKALSSIAQIVHDIDMKDNKFGRTEAPGVDAIVRSLSDSINDDIKVLEIGSSLLDGLYQRLSGKK